MKTIPISAKGFAEFVLAGPSKKATIVRNILKPKSRLKRRSLFFTMREQSASSGSTIPRGMTVFT